MNTYATSHPPTNEHKRTQTNTDTVHERSRTFTNVHEHNVTVTNGSLPNGGRPSGGPALTSHLRNARPCFLRHHCAAEVLLAERTREVGIVGAHELHEFAVQKGRSADVRLFS